ncbi:MAG: hypothetical protein G01um10148_357 [Parcubacteria group bacterium Gr01-1014_8]|nr:MAG: hypothetical protein G01um10148_357 [Parcubacteria group bacterium Gr01-1014_8]
MQRLLHFLSYNNAVPIAVSIVFLGGTATFAATNPEAIFDSEQSVLSIDNTYIANKDLSGYTPTIEILGVTEDSEKYYVSYRLTTIDVVDAMWRDVTENGVLEVAKPVLGQYGDLGLYATEQFKQLVDHEIAYLKEVQEIERKQVTPKIVATSYSGLVGKLLDDKTETLPGYTPVVTPPPIVVENVSAPDTSGQVAGASTSAVPTLSMPVIQILGPNPHEIPVGANFADLGVVVSDDSGYIPTVKTFVDGTLYERSPVTVDTSKPREWHIRYEATDTDGNIATAERLVIVKDPFVSQSAPESSVASSTSTTTEPTAASEPPPGSIPISPPESAPDAGQTSATTTTATTTP